MMRFLVCTVVVLLAGVEAAASDHGFSERARRLLEVAAGEEEKSFYSAAAKIRLGRDLPSAYSILDSMSRDISMGGVFYSYSLIGTYLHSRDRLPDSLHRKIRKAYRVRTMYRGDTENHWVTYYTGLYLAAQTWPGEDGSQWFNGRSSDENFREAEEWLTGWMKTTSTIGQGEFDSPTYSTVFFAPMLVLYEFASDPRMKTLAQATLDLLFADFAAEHLEGAYCGGHSRDYPDDIINPLAAPSTRVAWLYFGRPKDERWEEDRFRPRHRGSWETVFAALGSYRLPEIVYLIATDRSTPYVHTETKRVRNIIRFGDVRNPPVYKYTYMTADYALGSLQGGILQPIQQHTWDVTYVSSKPNNTLFTLHPFYSPRELAMFFPEELKFLAGEVDRYHLVYTNPGKWNSSSPYERTFQHKNALLVLYDIKKGEKHPHVDGFFPKTLDERIVDASGWIFSRTGTVYIAVRPLQPFEWTEESVNWRLRSDRLQNGFVVEVGREADNGTFAQFMEDVHAAKVRATFRGGPPRVEYVTTSGDRMEFTFGGKRILNGRPIDFRDYRLFNGPFIQADVGTGVITLKHGATSRILNFNEATIREE